MKSHSQGKMIGFGYHPEIARRYPDVCGGALLVQEAKNASSPESLREAFIEEQIRVKKRIGETPLSELDSLSAWRGVFRSFGVDPTKYRSAAEALLRRLVKKGDIPSINAMVDICNLVSIRYALPVAAFDAHQLQGVLTVRFAHGSEAFLPHDQEQSERPEPGEVIFSDETGLVFARRWCWKQSSQSVVTEATHLAVVTIESQHMGGRQSIETALSDLSDLMGRYSGGSFLSGVIDPDRLEIRSE